MHCKFTCAQVSASSCQSTASVWSAGAGAGGVLLAVGGGGGPDEPDVLESFRLLFKTYLLLRQLLGHAAPPNRYTSTLILILIYSFVLRVVSSRLRIIPNSVFHARIHF